MKRAKVLYQYDAADETQMTIYEEEIIEVSDTSNEEWWKGRVGNRSGWFPASYVELIKEPVAPPKRPIPIPQVTVSIPQVPAKPLPVPSPNNVQAPTSTRTIPTLMGSRGAIQENSSSTNANPVSPRNNFSARPMPQVPSINSSNNVPSIPQPTITKPLPTLNRPLPTASAAPSSSTYEAAPNVTAQYSVTKALPLSPRQNASPSPETTQTSQYSVTKALPLSPRQNASPNSEIVPVTPRSQWNDTTRAVVDRKPQPVPQPVIQPTTPSYSMSPYSNTQYSSPNNNSSSSNFSSSSNTTSVNATTTPSPSSFNSSYSTSTNQPTATVVQNLTEFPPTPSKVPKMEKLKSGDVVRLQIVEGRNFNLGEKPVVTIGIQSRGTTREIFKTGKGKSPTNPSWNEAFRINVTDPESENLILKAGTNELIFPLAKAKRNFDFPQHQYAWFKMNSLELKVYLQFKRM